MPKKTSSSDSDRGSHRRKKTRRHSSSSDESSDVSLDSKHRRRKARRSRSRSRDRNRRQKSRSRSSSRSPKKRSRYSRSRSSSRGRKSRHGSRSRSSSRSKTHGSKHKKSRHRRKSKSKSPSKSKGTGSKASHSHQHSPNLSERDEGTLKMKIQQVLKAAANASAELREKGLLDASCLTEATQASISEQMKRAQTIDEINSPSFSQQTFLSSRTGGKQTTEKGSEEVGSDAHSAAIFGLATPKLGVTALSASADASIKKLESWKENPEKLVHENLFADQAGKEEKWRKKLLSLRRRNINGEAYL